LALRVYGAWQSWTRGVSSLGGRQLEALTAAFDRPYLRMGQGVVSFLCLAALLAAMFAAR
jgi:hypothetical protein